LSSLKEKTKKAFIWDYLGNFLNYFLNFLITLILARLLTPNDYGVFAIAAAFTIISSLLVDTGLNSALIQRKDVTEEHYNSVFLFNLISGTVLFILFFVFSPYIAAYYDKPVLNHLIKIYSLVFILSAFGIVRRTKLRKELNFKLLNQINIISNFTSGVIAVICAFIGLGIWSLVIQALLNVFFANIILYFKIKINSKFTFKLKFSKLKYLWNFGFPVFISYLINKLVLSFESLFLGKIFSIDILGYFNRAQSFNNFVIVNTSNSLNNVFFPVLSIIQEDNEKIKNAVYKVLHLLCFAIFFLLGFLYITMDDLIIILLTEKWIYVSNILKVLMISGFSFPISSVLINILSGKGYSKRFLNLEIIRKFIFILNFATGIFFGFDYYIIGYTVVCILWVIINIFGVSGIIGLKNTWFYKIIFRYIFIAALLPIPILLYGGFIVNHFVHLIVAFFYFSSIYLFVNYILKNDGMFIFFSEIKILLKDLRLKVASAK
jgi:teichuronic acid exporter